MENIQEIKSGSEALQAKGKFLDWICPLHAVKLFTDFGFVAAQREHNLDSIRQNRLAKATFSTVLCSFEMISSDDVNIENDNVHFTGKLLLYYYQKNNHKWYWF